MSTEYGEQTVHRLIQGDARRLDFIPDESIHLVVTSPPYWILKRYNENPDQLGHVEDYEQFLDDLSEVWKHAYRVLVPGGRLVCVVGDVCMSRRKHPAPFPLDLASRLVRMFSFVGDTVIDPFAGTGTTMVAALRADRNSIGLDIDAQYCRMAAKRLIAETATLFNDARLVFQKSIVDGRDGSVTLWEEQADYTTAVP